jgi:hypothetical protein
VQFKNDKESYKYTVTNKSQINTGIDLTSIGNSVLVSFLAIFEPQVFGLMMATK